MQIISVWNSKGGVGTTTLALLLAGAMKNKGYKVKVVDMTDESNAVDVAKVGNLPFSVSAEQSLSEKDNKYDFVIYDVGSKNTPVEESDMVVVPIRPSTLDINTLAKSMSTLTEYNSFPVFNLCEMSRKEHQDIYGKYSAWPKLKNRAIYERMIRDGITIFNKEADSWASIRPAREEINALVNKLVSTLDEMEED